MFVGQPGERAEEFMYDPQPDITSNGPHGVIGVTRITPIERWTDPALGRIVGDDSSKNQYKRLAHQDFKKKSPIEFVQIRKEHPIHCDLDNTQQHCGDKAFQRYAYDTSSMVPDRHSVSRQNRSLEHIDSTHSMQVTIRDFFTHSKEIACLTSEDIAADLTQTCSKLKEN
jgi:hypothetical protein